MTPRVLGVDPGVAVTGYGVVEPESGRLGRLVECGVIRTDSKHEIWQRLDTVYEGVVELIERHGPSVLALETVFYGKNVRTALTLQQAQNL